MKNKNKLPVVVVIGASGFIGKKLVQSLVDDGNVRVITLERNVSKKNYSSNKTVIEGDLTKLETLQNLFVADCTVVNLFYSFNMSQETILLATRNLAKICCSSKIKKLIHCSTVSVYGKNPENTIVETSECNPIEEYGRTKLLIEKTLFNASRDNFEFINLRPTSVFGEGGKGLIKDINELNKNSMFLNYLKICLFNRRKVNLVSLDTVVAAIIFFLNDKLDIDGETFIISEDNEDINNYENLQNYLLKKLFNKKYPIKPIRIPLFLLSFILRIRGRNNTNPLRIYDSRKIEEIGFHKPKTLTESLDLFIELKKKEFKKQK